MPFSIIVCKVASIAFVASTIQVEVTSHILVSWSDFGNARVIVGERLVVNHSRLGNTRTVFSVAVRKDTVVTSVTPVLAPEDTCHVLETDIEICRSMSLPTTFAEFTIPPHPILAFDVFHR